MSSCRSKNLTPRRPTPVVVPTAPPQKPEGPLHLVDTSSQVSTEVAEASLEDIPTSISPNAAVSRTRSITPLVDVMELWANANKALEDLLTTKASIDACRWRAVWELGIELCQNESQTAKSIKEAKAICCWVTLDAQTTCSQLTLDAKTNCSQVIQTASSAAVKGTKTTRGLSSKRPKLPVPKPSERLRPRGPLRLSHSKGSIATSCGTWRNKSSKKRAEVEVTSSLPVRSPCMPAHWNLKALWLLLTTSYWGKPLHHLHSSNHRGLPL